MTWPRSYLTSRRIISTDAAFGAFAMIGAALTAGSTPAVAASTAAIGGLLLGMELEVTLQ